MAKSKVEVQDKRGRGRPSLAEGPAKILLTIRGRPAWGEWVKGIASAEATTPPDLIEQALTALALAKGYPIPPPRT